MTFMVTLQHMCSGYLSLFFPNYPSSFHVGGFFPHNDLWRGSDGDPDELILQQ